MGISKRKFKTITIKVELSEFNHIGEHTINQLSTKIINKTSKAINSTIKKHNFFNEYKVDLDAIDTYVFPNNIENNK
jgi:hypothetical protein